MTRWASTLKLSPEFGMCRSGDISIIDFAKVVKDRIERFPVKFPCDDEL